MTSSLPWWPWWQTALALALIPITHWLLLGRMFAVSGRFTSINDALRARVAELGKGRATDDTAADDGSSMSEEELIAAMREATSAAFGEAALGTSEPDSSSATAPEPLRASPPPQSAATHALFLAALVAGGAMAAVVSGTFSIGGVTSMGDDFVRTFGSGPGGVAALFGGGLLVGFGTRMSGGCTSGHGLCGVSRFQLGSLAATVAFFGTGIAVSLLIGALS